METVLTDHAGVVLIIVASVVMAMTPGLVMIGRILRRQDDHERRITTLEDGTVSQAVCKVVHESLNRELQAMRHCLERLNEHLDKFTKPVKPEAE